MLFEEWGGGETLAVHMYNAMRELGHSVDLYTTYIDPLVEPFLPKDIKVNYIKGASWVRKATRGRLVRLRRLLEIRAVMGKAKKMLNDYDLVIETRSNVPFIAHVSYIHFPALIDYNVHHPGELQWKLYDWAVARLAKSVGKYSQKAGLPIMVLTNSTWTANYICKAYSRCNAEVLYPPIDYRFFHNYYSDRRENIVVTVSRYSPEKHLEAIPRIASQVPEAEFYLIGTVSSYSGPVIEKLRAVAETYKADNFHMVFNASREQLAELLGKAKVYLHPPFPEHFGMAIAEAMSAGAVPVVFKDGGGWTDIVGPFDKSLGYQDLTEAVSIIKALLWNSNELREKSKKASLYASRFSYEKFKVNLADHLAHAQLLKKLSMG
jgi:glycosyltransferase involved in cell wall biosynthesis